MWLEPEVFFSGAGGEKPGGEKPGVCTAIAGGYYVHMVKCVTSSSVSCEALLLGLFLS